MLAAMGCAHREPGLDIVGVSVGQHSSVSDPVDLTIHFKNTSDCSVIFDPNVIVANKDLIIRLSRSDPLPVVVANQRGEHEMMTPFMGAGSEDKTCVRPGKTLDYPFKTSFLQWIYFIGGDDTSDNRYAGRWYLRVGYEPPMDECSRTEADQRHHTISALMPMDFPLDAR
jgi:hypothetical protein